MICESVPGLLVAAIPFVEKRHLAAVLLLVAKKGDFATDPRIPEICQWLGWDAKQLGEDSQAVGDHTRLR